MKKYMFILMILTLVGALMPLAMLRAKAQVSAELLEEVTAIPLEVSGHVPTWLSGTLVRNGPITITVNGQSNAHWFDGLAMLHAFAFDKGALTYTNKFLRSDAYRTVFEGRRRRRGGDSCDSRSCA